MKIREIIYSPEFIKGWKKVPKNIQKKAIIKEKIFKENCFNPLLKTHKSKGRLSYQWSFSVDYHWRAVFVLEDDKAIFTAIGTHRIYR